MGLVTVTAWRCDFPTCGHVWYTAKERPRCAKCKRKNWNKTGGDVIKAPKPKGARKKKPVVTAVSTNAGRLEDEKNMILRPLESAAPGWEKPVEQLLPTIIHAPVAERFQEALKHIAEPEHKIGEKCKHGWANWLQCDKCNPKVTQ